MGKNGSECFLAPDPLIETEIYCRIKLFNCYQYHHLSSELHPLPVKQIFAYNNHDKSLSEYGNGNSTKREGHSSRHSRGTGSLTYGIRTYIDSKEPRFQSQSKTFRIPESDSVILPCYTENLGEFVC